MYNANVAKPVRVPAPLARPFIEELGVRREIGIAAVGGSAGGRRMWG